jgi:hypothetical protein
MPTCTTIGPAVPALVPIRVYILAADLNLALALAIALDHFLGAVS